MTAPHSFSETALRQIIHCYWPGLEPEDSSSAGDAWVAMTADAATGTSKHITVVEIDEFVGARYHDHDDPVLRVVGLAGMIELGVEAGYIDLGELHATTPPTAVSNALASFETERLKGSNATDLTLFRRLRRRYEDQKYRIPTRDDTAFAMFEAYLGLTDSVLRDRGCLRFIEDTHGPAARRRLDKAVLLSPRHFADALATGRIGALEAPEVAGGLAMLRYLDRFTSILSQLQEGSELREGMVRNARWARDAQKLRLRFESWADAMREWSESGLDSEGTTAWSEYRSRVLWPLILEQRRLYEETATEGREGAPTPSEEAPAETTLVLSAEDDAQRLAAEGRVGAAQVRLRADAAERFETIRTASSSEWIDAVEGLVRVSAALAALGDVDSAAAYMSPLLDRMAEELGTAAPTYLMAAGIVAEARRPAPRAEPEALPNADVDAPLRPAEVRPREEPKYRTRGAGE